LTGLIELSLLSWGLRLLGLRLADGGQRSRSPEH
jgi:hypothetical protein